MKTTDCIYTNMLETMMKNNELKELVKRKYSEIALQDKEANQSSCCGSGCCSTEVYNIMSEDYAELQGYAADADLGLGCGLPTQYARIRKGDTVIDLGSGAGNDCFVARAETGETGKVIGVDFTPVMIAKARANADRMGFNNVEFREGDIECMPVTDGTADVVVSNCVLNLLPEKNKIFKEIFRVLKPEGRFCISDVVLVGELPHALKDAAEMYAGCVAGAIQKGEYLNEVALAGFTDVRIEKEKPIIIPNDILAQYLTNEELEAFNNSGTGIYSLTVTGAKLAKGNTTCGCGTGCC